MSKRFVEDITSKIEALRQSPLTEEERGELDLWDKGRALKELTGFYGWEVLLEMWKDYKQSAVDHLLATDPAQRDEAAVSHAIAWAINRQINIFLEDVGRAIEASKQSPSAMKLALLKASEVPPESL